MDRTGLSWNAHTLVTLAALGRHPNGELDQHVSVIPLEDFLSEAGSKVGNLVHQARTLIAAKNGRLEVDPGEALVPEIKTEEDLLRGLELNPSYRIPYVRTLRPDEIQSHAPHDQIRSGPPAPCYIPTAAGETVTGLEVLAAFADEPDWGMDQELFLVEGYHYGPCPFGPVAGLSSQAPFHMAFFAENRLLLKIWPALKRSFMEERIRIFYDLARLARVTGADYWYFRFRAWSAHYLQDLTQPYHARPVPLSWPRVALRILRQARLRGLMERNKNLLKNRHVLFEALVHCVLNDVAKRGQAHPFISALQNGATTFEGDVRHVMRAAGFSAASLALRANRILSRLIDDPRFDDPEYAVEEDPAIYVPEMIARYVRNRPHDFEEFVNLVADALSRTGAVTRYALLNGQCQGAPSRS
jgi:hypothetical protein